MKKIAVVTGASSGMGREFVRHLSRDELFDEIWVIARRRKLLDSLKAEVHVRLKPVCLDLTQKEALEEYGTLLEKADVEVKVLVNASGFGIFRSFEETQLQDAYDMIDLNTKAMLAVTYKTLPYMKEGGRIYQLGSLSAFQPVPYMNVYAATKAFVLSFSRALNVELKHRKIRVMAVCPGWVRTEFFRRAVTKDDVITYYNRFYESADVVKKALKDMKKGKDVSILGFPVRVQVWLTKWLPHRLVMKIWCRQQGKK